MDKITISLPGQPSATHELTRDVTTIGRRPDNNIIVADTAVSGHHAVIIKDESGFRIEDLNSTNGTYVGGLWIRRKELKNGDKLRFALVDAVFESERATAAKPAPTAVIPAPKPSPAAPAIPVPKFTPPPTVSRPAAPPLFRPPNAAVPPSARPAVPAPPASARPRPASQPTQPPVAQPPGAPASLPKPPKPLGAKMAA